MNEEWKDIEGFEGLYEVSNLGRVRSLQFHGKSRIKLMSQSNSDGYKVVKLTNWEAGIKGTYKVHILVAKAFIPNIDNKPFIDHIDTNRTNNVITNLRWVTHLENQNNPITLKRLRKAITNYNKSDKHKEAVTNSQGKKIQVYTKEGLFIKEYPSMSIAAVELNTTATCIKRVCDGDRKYHRNLIFKYK